MQTQALETLPGALAILSAMLTPAVLISACGSLIIATANRLARAVDRVRELADRLQELAQGEGEAADEERQGLVYVQLDRATSRARILQRAMSRLYLALSAFVATSVAIGIVAIFGRFLTWLPILLGLLGAGFLLHAALLLVRESRLTLATIDLEMDHVWRAARARAPEELPEIPPRRR